MHQINYEIKLNDSGRPCIILPDNYENKPEDRFFSIEITRYILSDIITRRNVNISHDTINKLKIAEALLGQVGDEVAEILLDSMKIMGDAEMILNSAYHIQVSSIEERDNLPLETYFVANNKLYKRTEGLKVFVMQPIEMWDNSVSGLYILEGGITNENWIKLS